MAAGGLGDLFSLSGGVGMPGGMYSAPKQVSYGVTIILRYFCTAYDYLGKEDLAKGY